LIPAHIAEQEESDFASLNPQRSLAAFKDTFTLKQLQLGVRRKNFIEARIQLDYSARARSLRPRREPKRNDQQS
jgi:hypothetical protein